MCRVMIEHFTLYTSHALAVVFYVFRSRLILSESLARHNPQSPFRRAPSILQKQFSKGGGVYPEAETDELLKMAKDNIKLLKQKGKQVKIVHAWELCVYML